MRTRLIVDRLLAWYATRDRHVPWRGETDPYRVWVGEVMAQQTRIGTVATYYERFLERFPALPALAAARLDEVLKAWEGMGYYGRARRLHLAARAGEPRARAASEARWVDPKTLGDYAFPAASLSIVSRLSQERAAG